MLNSRQLPLKINKRNMRCRHSRYFLALEIKQNLRILTVKWISHSQTKPNLLILNLTQRLCIVYIHIHQSSPILKSSRLFKVFISIGTICQTFEAKNLIEFTPYLLLSTEFLKKSDWVRKLYFLYLGGKILCSSIARLWMSVVNSERMILFEAIHEMNLCCLHIQFLVSTRVSDWFLDPILCHDTFKLVDCRQTGLQLRISLVLSFLLESYNLTNFLK